ncbi:MAG: hypothetical protein QM736_04065 [Vicinamibacterales bacterium]
MFYDALAGQGDFFQSGVLAPPFTPLVEINTPTPITIANPLAAVAGSGGPNPFPPALTVIGWGDDFTSPNSYHFNAGVQHQIGNRLGAEAAYVGSRGYNLPIFMEVNPGVYTRRADGERRARHAGVLAGPSHVLRRALVVQLAPGVAADAADARSQFPGVVHARACRRSRVGVEHRR